MIKFFRKIRQKLLSENKFSKYLIYAIGEIVLVVIGILIALNINNRNEFNKSYKETINNLNQVKYELEQDIAFFKSEIPVSERILKFFNHIKQKEFDSVEVGRTFNVVCANLTTPDISKSYNKLNESGNIDIIKDSLLTGSLHDYYLDDRIGYIKFAEFNGRFTSDKIEGYLIYTLELDENFECSEASVIEELDNGKLINLINYQSEVYKSNKGFAEHIIPKAENIIALINKEVNN